MYLRVCVCMNVCALVLFVAFSHMQRVQLHLVYNRYAFAVFCISLYTLCLQCSMYFFDPFR